MKSEGGMRNSERKRRKDRNREDKKVKGEMAKSKAHGEQCGGGYWMDE